jgi:hypothetical protein
VEAKTVEAAQQLWRGLIGRYETAARQYQALKALHMDTALCRRPVLDVAAPILSALEQAKLTPRQEGHVPGCSPARRDSHNSGRREPGIGAITRLGKL